MTTHYLLDTNACIAIRDLLGKKQSKSAETRQRVATLKARWSAVPKERLAMSVITLGELRCGVENSQDIARATERLEALRQAVSVLGIDETVTEHCGRIRAQLGTAGKGIGPNDTWIAAHGRSAGRTVVTHDGEFSRVDGLTVGDWMV